MKHLPKVHWQLVKRIKTMAAITEKMKPKGDKKMYYKNCEITKNYDSLTPLSDYLWSHDDYDGPESDLCGTGSSEESCKEAIDDLEAEGRI